jgi:hypothetical protein
MALVKLGEIVVGVRGTAGGLTFSANASGNYCKMWARSPNPRTPYQQTVRGNITRYGALWADLTDAERQDWTDFGLAPPELDYDPFGTQIYLTGWQWFCRIQQRRASVGQDPDTTLPSDVAVTPPASVTLSLEELPAGDCTVSWPDPTFDPDDSAIVYLAFHPSGALWTATRQFKLVLALQNPDSADEDITAAVLARFGAIRAGWFGHATLHRQRDDAVRSTPVSTREEVV